MNQYKLNASICLIAFAAMIAFMSGCTPDKMNSTLGAKPKANFDIVQGVSANNFILVNKSDMPTIPYWTVGTAQKLTGDSAKVNFTFAGTYSVTLMVSGHGGIDTLTKTVTVNQNDPTACQDPNNVQAFLAGCTSKKWRLNPDAAATKVGPAAGDGSWWSNTAADVVARACDYNDEYTFSFNAAGTFNYDNKGDFYDDGYLGAANYSCETTSQLQTSQKLWGPGTFQYVVTPASGGAKPKLQLIGKGAHMGMAKVQNGGEFPTGPVNNSVTYDVISMTHNAAGYDVLQLAVQAASGTWWTFTFRSY